MHKSFIADSTLIEALDEMAKRVLCDEGEILFRQGDVPTSLYILRSGMVTLIMNSPTGKDLMCLTVSSGAILGLPGIVANEPYTFTAIALNGSDVRLVSRKDFEGLIRFQPSLYPMVLEVLAAEVRSARMALSDVLRNRRSKHSALKA